MLQPVAGAVAVLMVVGKATSKYCDGGHSCPPPKECCIQGCCFMYSLPGYRLPAAPSSNTLGSVFWNHWYFWFVVFLLVLSCVGGCGLWRRRHALLPGCVFCCCRRGDSGSTCEDEPSSERDSAGSCCAPPHYSRCSSLHHAPPPYAEVTSKPDLYPLVISYGDNGKGAPAGSYLMVQYFRNYIVRPIGSVSATSTADSLSSSFLCSAANEFISGGNNSISPSNNEANTIVPPPYSCAGSLDEFRALTPIPPAPPLLLRSVSSLASFTGGAPQVAEQQSFASATALSTTGSDVSSLAGVGTPGSPPRATSPTLEIRELLDKIQQLPCGDDTRPKRLRHNRKNVYMPLGLGLGTAGPGPPRHKTRHWLSRSAPTTPSTHLPPSAIAPPRPASSGNGKDDGSPLLAEQCSDDDQEQDAGV